MITDLPEFLEKIRDNPLWWTRMLEMYPTKDHLQITKEVHLYLLASPERLKTENFADFRRLYQGWCEKHKGELKVTVRAVELKQEPVKEIDPKDMPLRRESPEYIKRTQELIDAIQGIEVKKVTPMTKEEREQNGQVRPKAHKFTQSPTEKAWALSQHQKALHESRRKFFLETFPDATDEEVEAYVNSLPI